ncbi:MAG: PAS domain S-box protein [Ignavibacteriales bacterium]
MSHLELPHIRLIMTNGMGVRGLKDQSKTKQQLISELEELRQQLSAYETAANDPLSQAEQLRHEDMYLSLIAGALFGYYIIQDDRFIFVNPKTAEIFGYTQEEMLNDVKALDVAYDDDKAMVADNMRKRLLGEVKSINYRLKGRKKDGTLIDIQVLGSRIMYRGRPAIQGNMIDITEMIQAKEALEESQRNLVKQVEYYNSLINNLNEGFCSVDMAANINFFNQKSWRVLDYQTKSIIGRNIMEFVPPDYEDLVLSKIDKVLNQGKGIKVQVPLMTRDGSHRIYQINASPILDDGVVIGGMILADDITEQKMAEQALIDSEARLKKQVDYLNTLIDNLNEFFCTYDLTGHLTFVNKKLYETMGYSRETAIGKFCLDFLPPEDQQRVLDEFGGPNENIPVSGYETHFLRDDGVRFTISLNYSPIIEDGVYSGGMILAEDITERKLAERALAEEKERLAVTLRSIGDGVISTNIDGKIVLINEVAEDFLGCGQNEALGQNVCDFLMLLDSVTGRPRGETVPDVVKGNAVMEYPQCILINRRGYERMVSISGAPIRDHDEVVGVVMVIRDITEMLKREEERAKTGKLESLGVLAGGIAHDFNNLLTVIMGNITLVKMDQEESSPTMYQLDEAEKAGQHAKELTKQLLTFARGGAPVKRPSSVEKIIRDAAVLGCSGTNVRHEISISDDLWQANIDEGQISQVISNLMINACQAINGDGLIKISVVNVIVTKYSYLPLPDGFYVKISVEDSGEGITEDNQQKIFDPYFTTKPAGSGLGLATSYTIVRNHGGYIGVQSAPGLGTIFSVYLPAIGHTPIDRGSYSSIFLE